MEPNFQLISDWSFDSFCKGLTIKTYENVNAIVFYALNLNLSDARCYNHRTKRVISILEKVPLPYTAAYPHLSYLCFIPLYISIPLVFSRPTWSRQDHCKLSHPDFKERVLTVLLMQRFRKAEFPLHRDVLDYLIHLIFEGELELTRAKIELHLMYLNLTKPAEAA